MPYDANLVLRGLYGGAYVDLDELDAAPTSLTVNADGNVCVDLGPLGTGPTGMDCVVIMHDQATTYQNTCDIVICESDHLDGDWMTILSFNRVYAYMRELIVRATTAFDCSDDIGQVLTATTGTDTGVIRAISRNLMTIGGVGKIFVEMRDAGDTYATAGDIVSSAVTGVGTMVGVGRVPNWSSGGKTLVRRFSTMKRYIRPTCTVSAGGNFGDVDILVTNQQHNHVNNLYRPYTV